MRYKNNGLTLIEIIVAVGILVFISTIGLNAFSSFKKASDLSSGSDTVMTYLIQARSKTLSAENGAQYGVHFESEKIVFFQGGSYIESDSQNQEIILPTTVEISSIILSGGGSDVLFKKLNGETDNDGTIILRLKLNQTREKTVSIKKTGLAVVQ